MYVRQPRKRNVDSNDCCCFLHSSVFFFIVFFSFSITLLSPVEYKVTIRTADMAHAGTHSAVYFSFIGTAGSSREFYAENTGYDRHRDLTDTWTFSSVPDVGEFRCIYVRMGGKDGWHFEEVTSSIRFDSWRLYLFGTYRWIASGKR